MTDTEKMLAAGISAVFSTLLGSWALYRALGKRKDAEIARLNGLLVKSAESHAALLERKEREKDAVEAELRGMYERMLDAAQGAKRNGPARPHRGPPEPLAVRRERLQTVTMELTAEEREEYARRLAEGVLPSS